MPNQPDRIAALPSQTPAEALISLADRLTEAFETNLALLMAEDSPDPIHKARVALRRFRTLLAAFAPILDDDLADALQTRARKLFRILAPIRDADVMAQHFAKTDRAAKTAAEAAQQRQKGRKALKRHRSAALRGQVAKRLSGKSWRQSGKKAKALREGPLSVLAARALSNGPDLAQMSVRAQHELRKDLKTLRYLAEFFAELWSDAASAPFLADLRDLQDDLGALSDSATARALGYGDATDTQAPQDRAAALWGQLVRRGPWWRPELKS